MATTLFVWLGSGRARRRRVHPRGQLLDQAAQASLPVPAGAILLDELFRLFLDKGLARSENGRIIVPDPELLHNTLFYSVRLPRFEQRVTIRPAFEPPVPARLTIDMNDPGAVALALSALWTAAANAGDAARADILVMDTVAVEHSGTAITRQDGRPDEATAGQGLAGTATPLVLPRLSAWQSPAGDLPSHARRLQMLLRGVRRTFGRGDWQIEWQDDGQVCYLLQVSRAPDSTSPI